MNKENDDILISILPEKGSIHKMRISSGTKGSIGFDGYLPSIMQARLHFQMVNGVCSAFCMEPFHFVANDGGTFTSVEFADKSLFRMESKDTRIYLYAETIKEEIDRYTKYFVSSAQTIYIGSDDDNDIVSKSSYVSGKHAIISIDADGWTIKDQNSETGVWVNGHKVTEAKLVLGDHICIVGLSIIVGVGFVSISDKRGYVYVQGDVLKRISINKAKSNLKFSLLGDSHFYNRSPRRREDFSPNDIFIEGPPPSSNVKGMPLMLRMGSSMVMGGASAIAGNYSAILNSVIFPFLTNKYTDKEKKEYEDLRKEKYHEYLLKKAEEIYAEKAYEETVLKKNYPESKTVFSYPMSTKQLWERRTYDDDFLCIRVGHGKRALAANINYPKEKFALEDDELENEMFALATKKVYLEDVPINIDFVENKLTSIVGETMFRFHFIKHIIAMISILHSYDEVKLIFLANDETLRGQMEFVRWLPHVWSDDREFRFIATNEAEAYQIGEYLKRSIADDIIKSRDIDNILAERPYYVIIALNKKLYDSVELLKDIIKQNDNCGVSIITGFEDVPKDCSILFDLKGIENNSILYLKDISRKDDSFNIDNFDSELFTQSVKAMSNISLKDVVCDYTLPKSLSFLDMFNVGKIEHLNIAKRWQENNPVKSLAAQVGVGADGSPFMLDLHQKYQGPHGLVAGTTGSGKSEFLITYILSMAVNYHPDEVAFVLIDYKGGGLASAFHNEKEGVHLPHLVGTITNLDGSSIQRSLISIKSEITRRQCEFEKVKQVTKEGTMDIYTYQRLYRNKVVSEPMPHLFIISDEFAELKAQQSEFMDELISAARIGRSLGIHLILATQKPAGVVDEQIRSNTKFRICLKVQDKDDSMDMLKRPEAAEIKETGRFFLQVGYNEFFALGQSGWAGADYEPQDSIVVKTDDSVQIVDGVGQSILENKPIVERGPSQGSQLVAIVNYIFGLAKDMGIEPRPLWKPELPNSIDLKKSIDNKFDGDLVCRLGLVDNPKEQSQFYLDYDFEKAQHIMIVGESGSGKTTMLHSIVYSLVTQNSSDDVNIYILDFSSRMMTIYKNLPHVGCVLLDDDQMRFDNLFELVDEIIAERKALFNKLNAESYSHAKSIAKIPLILVVVDNIAGLAATKQGEKIINDFPRYLRESLNYGIRFVITSSHLNELSNRIKQEIAFRICFRLRDKYDYSDALNVRVNYTPPNIPGRGLVAFENESLEFQATQVCAGYDTSERLSHLKDMLNRYEKAENHISRAKRLKVIDPTAEYRDFCEQFSKRRIPIGFAIDSQNPIALPLKQMSKLTVYQGNPEGKFALIDNFLYAAKREKMDMWFFKQKDFQESYFSERYLNERSLQENAFFRIVECTIDSLTDAWHELANVITERRERQKKYCTDEGLDLNASSSKKRMFERIYAETKPVFIMFENFSDFDTSLDNTGRTVFDALLNAIEGLNVYAVGMFSPDDAETTKLHGLFSAKTEDEMVMLFGGNLKSQKFIDAHYFSGIDDKDISLNTCMFLYEKQIHTMIMPCGPIKRSKVDVDDANIFL